MADCVADFQDLGLGRGGFESEESGKGAFGLYEADLEEGKPTLNMTSPAFRDSTSATLFSSTFVIRSPCSHVPSCMPSVSVESSFNVEEYV